MVLICPFIMKIYRRLLFHVIPYFRIEKTSGKSRFRGKATLVSVVEGYRNTMHIYQNTVQNVKIHTHQPVVGTLICLSCLYVVS